MQFTNQNLLPLLISLLSLVSSSNAGATGSERLNAPFESELSKRQTATNPNFRLQLCEHSNYLGRCENFPAAWGICCKHCSNPSEIFEVYWWSQRCSHLAWWEFILGKFSQSRDRWSLQCLGVSRPVLSTYKFHSKQSNPNIDALNMIIFGVLKICLFSKERCLGAYKTGIGASGIA